MERYESLGVVGEGSYGVVLRCRRKDSGQEVAVKKFLESDEDPNVRKIALREVRMLKKVRHENLVNLIEFFRRKRRLYLVFEYVDHTVLDELEASDGGLEASVARSHIFQVIRGVAFCHQNQIIHRDVKPENVLVSRLGVVKLCDFGFARLLEGPNESCTDYVATRWYRAPELLVGDTKYGREVDVWAIGCLLAEILSGDPLFPGDSDIDQLFHIIQTLGELSESHQILMEKNPMLSGLRLPTAASSPLSKSFPKWPPRTLLFISECLRLSPQQRPSTEGLLKHEYFTHDRFPETFLPELRKKVQQEFSSNNFVQEPPPSSSTVKRRGSAGGGRKASRGKNQSPENIINKTTTKNISKSPKKQILSNPAQSQHEASTTSLQPQPHGTTSCRPFANHVSLTSSSKMAMTSFPFDEGPVSLPFSHIPPIREPQASINTMNPYSNTLSSILSNSLHVNHTNDSFTHVASPRTTHRKEEKRKKFPQNFWCLNPKDLSIQGQNQFLTQPSSVESTTKEINAPSGGTLHIDAPNPFSPFSRHHQFDLSRHPYAISLDRTKDASGRETNRDPLKELKENGKDTRKETLGSREGKDPLRKSRKEVSGWAKPKLLNDDLYLPNVPGVSTKGSSPKKSLRTEGVNAIGGDVTSSGNRHRRADFTMPILSGLDRGSASSNESFDILKRGPNLPYV